MISVKCNYINQQSKKKRDYFIYTDVEVMGHADALNMSHTTGIKVCAGVSACCYGIRRLIDEGQFGVEIRKGYFHIWTERTKNLKQVLDKESVYALNTLVCQLFELYCEYPSYFNTFELNDIKGEMTSEKRNNTSERQHHKRRRNLKGMGLYTIIKETHY